MLAFKKANSIGELTMVAIVLALLVRGWEVR